MVFLALVAMPFALFDLGHRAALSAGHRCSPWPASSLAESDLLAELRSVSDNYSPAAYRIYSAT